MREEWHFGELWADGGIRIGMNKDLRQSVRVEQYHSVTLRVGDPA